MRPLLCTSDEMLDAVRRHAGWLKDWLFRNAGWTLHVERDMARLHKLPADARAGSRAAYDPSRTQPFSRRRYVLLCLSLAALERSERQTTLGGVATQVLDLLAGDPTLEQAGVVLDLRSREHRRDLATVMRTLIEWGVLQRVDGDEDAFVAERGDVLYGVNRPALAHVLSVRRGPSVVEAESVDDPVAAIIEEPVLDSDEGRNRMLRWRLTRRLLDDPVVYFHELHATERGYLEVQRGPLIQRLCEATGLVPEVRAEGVALVDADGDLTDVPIPEEGTNGHVTLLLAEHLAKHAREQPGLPLGMAAIEAHTAFLIDVHKGHWRKDVRAPGAAADMAAQVVERLEALHLVRRTDRGILPLPAIARFSLADVVAPPGSEGGTP
jgi:uncharacterized protein (TIGR02678 family)